MTCRGRGNGVNLMEGRNTLAVASVRRKRTPAGRTAGRPSGEAGIDRPGMCFKPWRKKEWCIPKVSAEFVACMEDVLDLYAEPSGVCET